MVTERRHYDRVQFGRGYMARVMAIDGTWQRDCHIGDVSDTGAKLRIRGAINAIDTQEFFLMLSPTGNAFRRCERIWLDGDQIGVRFLKDLPADGQPPRAAVKARSRRPRRTASK
jgi:hypothetical protein